MPINSRASLKQSLTLLVCLLLLIIALSAQAQDAESTAEILPVTETPLATVEPTLPTVEALPSLPTQEVVPTEPTALATVEASPVFPLPTEEPVAQPTEDPGPIVITPETLALYFSANFDAEYPATLTPTSGWVDVAVTNGKALQAGPGATEIFYQEATFTDAAVEARVLLNNGGAHVLLRGYAAGLSADGLVTLYRNQLALVSSSADLASGEWNTVRLEIIGAHITISVDGAPVIDYTDSDPLPQGRAGFAASYDAILRVDDFAIYGIPTTLTVPVTSNSLPLPGDGEPPAPPTGVNAISNGSTVTVSWTAQAGMTYEIERYVGNSPVTIGSTAASNFAEVNIGCGLTVWYHVRAIRTSDGQSSEPSARVRVSTPACVSTCPSNAAVQRVSVGDDSTYQGNGLMGVSKISDDGLFVFFNGALPLTGNIAAELNAEPEPATWDVYRHELSTCTTVKLSLTTANAETPSDALLSSVDREVSPAYFRTDNTLFARTTTTTPVETLSINEFPASPRLMEDAGRYLLMDWFPPDSELGYPDNFVPDLLVYDTTADTYEIVTLSADSANLINNSVDNARILVSDNKVYVVFGTAATNLINNDMNGTADVFVRDLSADTTYRLSLTDNETPLVQAATLSDAIIVNNELYVTFDTADPNIVSGVSGAYPLSYLRKVPLTNLSQGTTTLISRANGLSGTIPNGASTGAQLAANGLYAAFTSQASNLLPNNADTNGVQDAFVRDLVNHATVRVSTNNGAQLATGSSTVDISGSGTKILFSSADSALMPNAALLCETDFADFDYADPCLNLFVATYTVDLPLPPPSNITSSTNGANITLSWTDVNSGESHYEVERHVSGTETVLVEKVVGTINSVTDANVGCGLTLWYRVRTLKANGEVSDWSAWVLTSSAPCAPVACNPYTLLQRVSIGTNNQYQTNEVFSDTSRVFLSQDGRYVTFESRLPLTSDIAAENAAEPEPSTTDVYRYDIQTCTTTKLSIGSTGGETPAVVESNQDVNLDDASRSGATAFFDTLSPNLVPSDTDHKRDVFSRRPDEAIPVTTLLGRFSPDGLTQGDILEVDEGLRYQLIEWNASDTLIGLPDNPGPDLVLFDSIAQSIKVVTVNPARNAATNGTDGHLFVEGGVPYVLFTSDSQQIITGDTTANVELYLRDTLFNVSYRLSVKPNGTMIAGDVTLLDALIKDGVVYALFQSFDPTIVAGGDKGLLYLRKVSFSNILTGTTEIVSRADGVNGALPNDASWDAHLSDDGNFVVFTSAATNLVSGDSNGKTDVFIRDLINGTTRRVSVTTAGAQLTADSRAVGLSSDGSRILFLSEATNLIAGDSNLICEVDGADSNNTLPGVQGDYDENCPDLFVRLNPSLNLPATPANFTATTNLDTSIHLSWSNVAGVTRYIIEASNDNGTVWTQIASVDQSAEPTLTYDIVSLLCNNTRFLRVRSIQGSVSSVPSPSVTGSTRPCPPPQIVSPNSGAVLTDNTPDLVWQAVPNITVYEIDIAPVPTFFPHTPGYPKEVSGTTHTPTVLPEGTYYWKVRTKLPDESLFSSPVRTFTIDTQATDAPVPSAPSNFAIERTPRPTFKWGAVTGAASYRVVLDDDEDFSSPVDIDGESISGVNFTPAMNIPQGDYVWRVYAADAIGNESLPSVTMHLTVNPAQHPLPGTLITLTGAAQSSVVVFTWATATGVTESPVYQVEVDEANPGDFTSLVSECTSEVPTLCSIPPLDPGAYVWRVLWNGEQPVSIVSNSFFITPPAPRAPTQLSPLNNAFLQPAERVSIALEWGWGTAGEPAGGPFTFEVEVYKGTTFDTVPVYTGTASGLSASIGSIDVDGVYIWRVRAINDYDVPGAWSAGFRFNVDSAAPDAPVILTPTENTILANARPTFTWNGSVGAVRYALEINNTCGDGSPVYSTTTPTLIPLTATTYTIPTTTALPQGAHVVCVRAFDQSGNSSPFSAARAFTIFLGTGPANGIFIPVTGRPAFTWAATAGTTQLMLEYDTDTNFNSGAVQIPVTGVNKTLAASLPAGTYHWRVVRSGETFSSNVYRTFFVGALTAGPAPTTPALGASINTSSVTLAWNAGPLPLNVALTGYEMQISTASNFASILGTLTSSGPGVTYPASPFTLPPNQNGVTYYWRVRGLNNGLPITNWGSSRFILDNLPPTAPVVTLPTQNAILNTVRPTFTWGAVAGAKGYRIQLVDTSVPPNVIIPETPTTTPSYVVTNNLAQGNYILRVQAVDGPNSSAWTSVTFIVRLGTAPAQGASVPTKSPTFTWTAVPNATAYELQIDDDDTFEQGDGVLRTIPLGKVVSYVLTPALPGGGVYYWRIKPNTPEGAYPPDYGARMFSFNAVTKATNLAARVSTEVGRIDTVFNQTEDEPIVLTWSPSTGSPHTYEVQVSAASTFPTVGTQVFTTSDDALSLPEGTLSDGTKYWRVKTVYSDDGLNFVYSDVKAFSLDTVAPQPPVSTLPLNSIVTTKRPVFSWTASLTAVQYRLTVTDTVLNAPVTGLNDLIVKGVSYTVPTSLAPFIQSYPTTRYEWFVQAEDAAGNLSPASGFITRHVGIFVGTAPAAGLFTTVKNPTFTWPATGGTGASPWILDIARDAAMTTLARPAVTIAATGAGYAIPAAQPLTPGLYFWRVRYASEPTTIQGRPFYVIGTATSVTSTLTAPANADTFNAAEVSAGQTFSWSAITPPAELAFTGNYQIEIATASTFAAASIKAQFTVAGATSTLWPTAPISDGTYYWRVRGVFGAGDLGPASAVRSFKVDTTPPSAAVLKTPLDNAIVKTRTPALTWTAGAGATQYEVQVDTDASFSPALFSKIVNAPTVTLTLPPSGALANGLYYWRVVALDAAGNPMPTAPRPFTVTVP